MTTNRMLLLGLALLAGLTPVFARPPEVKLFGRKDRVLAPKLRADALAAMDAYLQQDDPAFSSLIEQVGNPYDYVPEVVEVAEPEETPECGLRRVALLYRRLLPGRWPTAMPRCWT